MLRRKPRVGQARSQQINGPINLIVTGLFLGMFSSALSMNVVAISIPVIIADIGGTQASLTWAMVAAALTLALSTPVWGKLADTTNKKRLLQASLLIFVLGAACAGIAQDAAQLIVFRAFQGIGSGGIVALIQIILADVVSARERGKYLGIMNSVMAISTLGGPLLGGLVTDFFGWRWNFYITAPFVLVAIILLNRTLKVQRQTRAVSMDYFGVVFISAGISTLMIWVTLIGTNFSLFSWQSAMLAGVGGLSLIIALFIELRVKEPLIPLRLFKNRTFSMSVIASISSGAGIMATAIFFAQYMQIARSHAPTTASLFSIPMVFGMLVMSIVVGFLITRTGKWKRYIVTGAAAALVGFLMMGQLDVASPYWYVVSAMLILGVGAGMSWQNLVLIVQNTVRPSQVGSATATVMFFFTLGGSVLTALMGALLNSRIRLYIGNAFTHLEPEDQSRFASLRDGQIPDTATLPDHIRVIVESAYGAGIGDIFLAVTPLAAITLVATILLPRIPLQTSLRHEDPPEISQLKRSSRPCDVSGERDSSATGHR